MSFKKLFLKLKKRLKQKNMGEKWKNMGVKWKMWV